MKNIISSKMLLACAALGFVFMNDICFAQLTLNMLQSSESMAAEQQSRAEGCPIDGLASRGILNAVERIGCSCRRPERVAIEQPEQRRPTQSKGEPAEEVPAIHLKIDMRAVHKRNSNVPIARDPSPFPGKRFGGWRVHVD